MKNITALRKMTVEELKQELKDTRPETYRAFGITASTKSTLIYLITRKYTR